MNLIALLIGPTRESIGNEQIRLADFQDGMRQTFFGFFRYGMFRVFRRLSEGLLKEYLRA